MKITQGPRVTWGGDEDLGLHEHIRIIRFKLVYIRLEFKWLCWIRIKNEIINCEDLVWMYDHYLIIRIR